MAEIATMDMARQRQLAGEHKEKIREALAPVIEAMEAARLDGFQIGVSLGPDSIGRWHVSAIQVSKVF